MAKRVPFSKEKSGVTAGGTVPEFNGIPYYALKGTSIII